MNRVRCAIVGLGRIGSLLEDDRYREKPCTHAGAIRENDECILVGGCDRDQKRCRLFLTRWGCTAVYTDLKDLLRNAKPDILHIATPPETHLKIVEKVLISDVRLIICEKPLASTTDEAAKIAAYHRLGGIKIITNHERRYSKDYRLVKEHIARGDLGSLLSINSRIYMGKNRRVTEMLLDDGTHLIDIMRYITASEFRDPQVKLDSSDRSDTLTIMSRLGYIPVSMEIGSGRDHIVFELDLSFSSGRIRIGNGLYEEFRSGPSPFYEKRNSLIKSDIGRPEITGYFANMLKDAVRCVRNENAQPLSTAVDGFYALKFIDRVKELLSAQDETGVNRTVSRLALTT